jgi:glycogen operon protein
LEKHADVHRFVKLLASQRVLRGVECERTRASLLDLLRGSTHAWHGVKLYQPDWSPSSRSLALSAELLGQGVCIHWILNSFWEPLDFELPPANGGGWRRWIDTALDSPQDIVDWAMAPVMDSLKYRTGPRSVAVLYAGLNEVELISDEHKEK